MISGNLSLSTKTYLVQFRNFREFLTNFFSQSVPSGRGQRVRLLLGEEEMADDAMKLIGAVIIQRFN